MCRPSCCNNSGGQGTGVAAVAILIGAALVAAKIGPAVAKIVHVALEVIRFAALTTAVVVVLAVFTWAAVAVTRWQLRRRVLMANPIPVTVTRPWECPEPVTGRQYCLACGGNGTVLRAIGAGQYKPRDCPVCEPVRRAG
jgi:hypothetical protein